jgi:DNA-binding transcriptional LysR family regulator
MLGSALLSRAPYETAPVLGVRLTVSRRATTRKGSLPPALRELHLARLEEEVGTALITRLGRGVRLTDAGQALVEHADAVLTRLTAAEEDVAAIAGLRAGRVRIVTFPSAGATLMAGALTRLRAAHPGIEVSFEEAEPEDAIPQLRSGDADMVLGFSYAAVGRSPAASAAADTCCTSRAPPASTRASPTRPTTT